ncbi:hypothetical protein [Rhizobium leguminosarum]|uniref:hypothetical protein n=1 Tax=Rhizobium leguminosarum TaxID=384 RepID=UPI00103BDCB5|nr:hypothetical protein [Rhizobium leguminosarum]TCA10307.1 hypothetical protein E0H57_05665 [Rhizobium leguminosarum bv. viciae]
MKSEAFQSLVVARALFDQVDVLMYADNKYSSSAALVILQDALELVLRAALVELGLDEIKNLENASFDQLIADLRATGVAVPKTGTIKAMNKGRVTVKHHGQLAEHETVKNFVAAAQFATAVIMDSVFNVALSEVFAGGQLKDDEIRSFISAAADHIAKREGFSALLCIRKAIFVAIEAEYDIGPYADPNVDRNNWSLLLSSRGRSAPWHTRTPQFIEEHVQEPFDFIQFNHEKLRVDLMEWGINTQDFWNIRRLTPAVYRKENEQDFVFETINSFDPDLELENAKYCLDRAINVLQKIQAHKDNSRSNPYGEPRALKLRRETTKYKKAARSSETAGTLPAETIILCDNFLIGLDGEAYVKLFPDFSAKEWFWCYVVLDDCYGYEELDRDRLRLEDASPAHLPRT